MQSPDQNENGQDYAIGQLEQLTMLLSNGTIDRDLFETLVALAENDPKWKPKQEEEKITRRDT